MLMTNPDVRFYDTCSLLIGGESIFAKGEQFLISSITLQELERIKTSSNKDSETKFSARLILHLLEYYKDMYKVVIHRNDNANTIDIVPYTDDLRILNDAILCNNGIYYNGMYTDRIIFVTNDLALANIANLYFGDGMIEKIDEDEVDDYTGFKIIEASDKELADFYSDTTVDWFELMIGEYLILKDKEGKVVDVRCWTGSDHRYITVKPFDSTWFGKITPFHDDIYQKLLFDSLINNKITMVKGPAGSGKTQISLTFLMHQLEKGRIDKIIIFCNTVATANSAKLGFYPGTKDEKLLDSQIGNLLVSKFGSKDYVDRMINEGKLLLLPMSDIRGYDTTGMKAGVYISEAQNLDRTLIKLALQRIGEDSICIIDGDSKTQVDDIHFSGNSNGMRRVSKVYRGHDIYGEVELKTIYRSKIAEIAEEI